MYLSNWSSPNINSSSSPSLSSSTPPPPLEALAVILPWTLRQPGGSPKAHLRHSSDLSANNSQCFPGQITYLSFTAFAERQG